MHDILQRSHHLHIDSVAKMTIGCIIFNDFINTAQIETIFHLSYTKNEKKKIFNFNMFP